MSSHGSAHQSAQPTASAAITPVTSASRRRQCEVTITSGRLSWMSAPPCNGFDGGDARDRPPRRRYGANAQPRALAGAGRGHPRLGSPVLLAVLLHTWEHPRPCSTHPRKDERMRIFLRNAVWLPAMMLVPVLSEAQVWTSTAPMAQERVDHTATKLVSGEVLVAGGQYGIPSAIYDGSNILASAELYSYDPATRTGTWRPTGSLKTARSGHTATVLPSGEVLVWGGANSYSVSGECDLNVLACAELYDPVNGTWRATAPLATVRYSHTATLLDSGKVLIAGGDGIVGEAYGRLASAELYSYDPATGTGSSTSTGFMITPRTSHTATKLLSGKVLFVGGIGNSAPWLLASAELYSDDPATGTGTWSDTDTLLPERWGHTATH